MDEKSFNKIASIVLIAILVILTFLILKPILISVIFALVLSFIFYPVHKKLVSWVKNKNLSALIICLVLLLIIILPIFFMIPTVVKQTFEVYKYIQAADVLAPFKTFFPSFFIRYLSRTCRHLIITMNIIMNIIISRYCISIETANS